MADININQEATGSKKAIYDLIDMLVKISPENHILFASADAHYARSPNVTPTIEDLVRIGYTLHANAKKRKSKGTNSTNKKSRTSAQQFSCLWNAIMEQLRILNSHPNDKTYVFNLVVDTTETPGAVLNKCHDTACALESAVLINEYNYGRAYYAKIVQYGNERTQDEIADEVKVCPQTFRGRLAVYKLLTNYRVFGAMSLSISLLKKHASKILKAIAREQMHDALKEWNSRVIFRFPEGASEQSVYIPADHTVELPTAQELASGESGSFPTTEYTMVEAEHIYEALDGEDDEDEDMSLPEDDE